MGIYRRNNTVSRKNFITFQKNLCRFCAGLRGEKGKGFFRLTFMAFIYYHIKWKVNLTFFECYDNISNVKLTCHIVEVMGNLKNRLEEFRKKHGLTQEELAEKLQVSRQTIGSLENGRYNPSILLAFKIARLFGVSIEEIFLYEEENENEK